MAKVSKNIKKLRTDRGLTQDALAEKICVTRQTISSWENSRTLPDIEMLEHLAEVFEVGVEELIYGEKKKIGLEPPKSDKRKIMNIVFATLGSLLTATGLIIIFVAFFDKIPDILLMLLCYVPLLLGGGIAIFAYSEKRNSIGWSEGASVAWIAGLAATYGLIISIHNLNINYLIIWSALAAAFLITALMINSLFPMIGYYFIVCLMVVEGLSYGDPEYPAIIIGIILFFLGFIYVIKAPAKDYKRVCTTWLSLISAVVIFISASSATSNSYAPIFCILLGICAALYSADTGENPAYPFRFIAVPAIAVMLTMLSFDAEDFLGGFYIKNEKVLDFPGVAPFIFAVIVPIGIYLGRKSFKESKEKSAFVALTALTGILCAVKAVFQQYIISKTADLAINITAIIIALSVSVIIIVAGIKKAKMLTVNLGLVMLCTVIFLVLIAGAFDTVTYGITCIVMGGALLFINFRLSKTFKAKEAEQNA